jgi:uncharacterized protein (DUF1697 family)
VLRFIAFLRAINVGRGRTVKMQSLRQVFDSLGFYRVVTFIASGNVIFTTTKRNIKMLEKRIEKRLREVLGYEVRTFIRTESELSKIASYQPFPQSKLDPTASINIIFLANRLDRRSEERLRELQTKTDTFQVYERDIYWLRRRKENGGPFSTVPLERIFGRAFTVRGADTVKKIVLKCESFKDC